MPGYKASRQADNVSRWEAVLKFFEILQKRVDNEEEDRGYEDKYTIHFHNPLWFILGAIPGYWIGRGVQMIWHEIERMFGG
jgi:hypothetical protein